MTWSHEARLARQERASADEGAPWSSTASRLPGELGPEFELLDLPGRGVGGPRPRPPDYQLLYAMRSAAFWMSAAGLYADGRNTDLRLARTGWSVTVALERAAQELGY